MAGQFLKQGFTHNVLRVGRSRFWAERGLIHSERDDGDYRVQTVRQFLKHINGISDMLGNKSAKRDQVKDAKLRKEYQDTIDAAFELAKRAQEQGMPSDAGARRAYVRARPKSICVSGKNSVM